MSTNKHVKLQDIENYIRNGQYPAHIQKKETKVTLGNQVNTFQLLMVTLRLKGPEELFLKMKESMPSFTTYTRALMKLSSQWQ